jgi:tRNA pseudouridine32 synthase/23S rRNA pseudouridine746 synthase
MLYPAHVSVSLAILAIDAHAPPRWVAIDKPAGLLSVPGKDPALPNARALTSARYPHATGPMTVHRLDMATSGVLLLALDAEAHRHLSAQFEFRRTAKTYIAHLLHPLPHDRGIVAAPLRLDPLHRPRQVIDALHGRPAATSYLRSEHDPHRVTLTPHTGRAHQLRLHMASLGCPILGDDLYGGQPPAGAPRLHLHAATLTFADPTTGASVTVTSPVPF